VYEFKLLLHGYTDFDEILYVLEWVLEWFRVKIRLGRPYPGSNSNRDFEMYDENFNLKMVSIGYRRKININ